MKASAPDEGRVPETSGEYPQNHAALATTRLKPIAEITKREGGFKPPLLFAICDRRHGFHGSVVLHMQTTG